MERFYYLCNFQKYLIAHKWVLVDQKISFTSTHLTTVKRVEKVQKYGIVR